MTGSHEVKGSIPFGSTNYPTLCRFIVTILWQIGAEKPPAFQLFVVQREPFKRLPFSLISRVIVSFGHSQI